MRKLAMLSAATKPDDLRILPGNRLETLAGKMAGLWSIRINDQWRVCFKFADGHAFDVESIDCH